MPSVFPVVLAIASVLALALVGAILVYLRSVATFKGYEEILADARAIRRMLEGSEVFRDAGDLVVSGNYQKLPTMVRFSHGEHTPGLYVRMGAPATFTMSVAGRGVQAEGRALLKTGYEPFDARFAVRSDHPSDAKMLLGNGDAVAALSELCCSSKTFFGMGVGALELSELVIPPAPVVQHVEGHLKSMVRVAGVLGEMPGAHQVKVHQLQHEHSSLPFRLIVAGGIVLALVVLGFEVRKVTRPPSAAEAAPVDRSEQLPPGIFPVDAALIRGVQRYRLARIDEFDPAAVNWLRSAGQPPAARITGDFSGRGVSNDVAYVLLGADSSRRLVLLVHGENRYDANYPFIGIAARVPKSNIGLINWVGQPPQNVDGDGLLVTLKPDDPASGLVLFTSGDRIVTGVPANYQAVRLD